MSFQAFRDRYPNAHITSDLVSVQGDRYVVKVTITLPKAGSASGLAAHATVEMAEDHARQRALAALGYVLPDSPNPTPDIPNGTVSTLPTPHDETSEAAPVLSPASESTNSAAVPKAAVRPQAPTSAVSSPQPPMPELPAAAKPVKPTATPTPIEPAIAPTEDESAAASDATTTSSATAVPPSPAETSPIAAEALPAPINLSDVIAQTDIELRRLGWSVEAGRDYLEQTYQKRSRHELSEEELIQFLCHLESLPIP